MFDNKPLDLPGSTHLQPRNSSNLPLEIGTLRTSKKRSVKDIPFRASVPYPQSESVLLTKMMDTFSLLKTWDMNSLCWRVH